MEQNERQLLKDRVNKVKIDLKAKGIKRDAFFDNVYGSMYDGEHTRKVNLWQCKIADTEFTTNLENFARLGDTKVSMTTSAEFKRFMAFEQWYLSLGGEPLTLEQIEKCYPKF